MNGRISRSSVKKGDLVRIVKHEGYPTPFNDGKIGIVMSHEPGTKERIWADGQEMFLIIVEGMQGFEYRCNLEPVHAQD